MTQAQIVIRCTHGQANGDAALARFHVTARDVGLAHHRIATTTAVASCGLVAVGRHSMAAGHVFAHSCEAAPSLSAICARLDAGEALLPTGRYWGDYLHLTVDADGRVLAIGRSPVGALPLFWLRDGRDFLAATSIDLLRTFAQRALTIDWNALATYLLSPQLRGQETCLAGVRELPAGFTLEATRDQVDVAQSWSPWTFAASARPLETMYEAVQAVGSAIDHAITARCCSLRHPVLLLSGGLDSSTIAAALARADIAFASVTMATRQKSGDERPYARAVAKATGSPLTEVMRDVAAIDWDDATPRRLARPSARVFRQPSLAAACALAAKFGSNTIIDGGGGDNVFCSLQSVAPLLDRWLLEGVGRGAWDVARETALRADVSVAAVLGRAIGRRLSGRVRFHWPVDTTFLHPEVQTLAVGRIHHPWLDPPRGALPGQAAHVALVLDALGLAEDDSTDPAFRTLSPLVAQPVVEAALRVRSWLWFEGGRNRAVIRRALCDRLPATVLARTGKGTPMGFMGEIVEAHHHRLRALLLDGLLVRHGIVDADMIAAALTPENWQRNPHYAQLLIVADAERWARVWA